MASFDAVPGPHGAAPKDIDIQGLLDVLFFDFLVHIVAVDDFLVD